MVSLYLRAAAAALGVVLSSSMIGALPAAAADNPGASAPAVTAPAASAVVAQSSDDDSFSDVPPNHWAYQAVQELAADGYIKGYPDGTFRGNRPLTRYEMAALTDRALSAIKAALINGDDVNARDIAALKKLMAQYAGQLKDVQTSVAAIKAQQAALASQESALSSQYSGLAAQEKALQAQANAATVAIARNRGGVQMSYKPGTSYWDQEVVNGPYARAAGTNAAGAVTANQYLPAITAGGNLPASYGYNTNPVNPNSNYGIGYTSAAGINQNPGVPVGPHAQGIETIGLKPFIQGNLDAHVSYSIRLAWTESEDTPIGGISGTPTYCTATTGAGSAGCVYQDVKANNASIPVTFDTYQMNWASQPGGAGLAVSVGKVNGGGGAGTRNVNKVLNFGKSVGGAVDYRDSKTDWLETGFKIGQPNGEGSLALAATNAATAICANPVTQGLTTVPGINPYCNGNSTEVQTFIQLFNKNTGTAIGFANDALNNELWNYWDGGAAFCATSAPNAAAGNTTGATVVANRGTACPAGTFALAGPGGGVPAPTGAYIAATGRITYNDLWISQVIGPKALHQQVLQYDYSWRPGNDPFATYNHDCGAATCPWTSTATQEFTYIYASKGNTLWGPGVGEYSTTGGPGAANSNVIYASVDLTGLNGIVYPQGPNGPWEGVGDNVGIGNYAGTQFEALQYVHWFTDNLNLNLGFVHQGTLPHTTIPVGGATCPGCYVSSINSNVVFLDAWLAY